MEQLWPLPKLEIEEVTDPVEIAHHRAVAEAFERNSSWLEKHWADVLPQARGKILAVAGQEPFVADTIEEAVAWTKAKHPEDIGVLVQYVPRAGGPRIYANRWYMAALQ